MARSPGHGAAADTNPHVGIQSFELMRAEHIWRAMRGSFLAIRALVYLLIGLSYLGYVLAVFPWTRSTTSNVLDFALGPLTVIGGGIVANIPSLVFLTVLFVMVRLLLRLISSSSTASTRAPSSSKASIPNGPSPPTSSSARGDRVRALSWVIPIFPESQSDAFKGVSLFIGVVFSLGSSSAISTSSPAT